MNPNELTLEEFDRNSQELLFKKLCRDQFATIIRYPEVSIKMNFLDKYWKDILSSEIKQEVDLIIYYESKFNENAEARENPEFIFNMQCYSKKE